MTKLNKIEIIEYLKNVIKQNLAVALEAARNTYDIATHEENKAENKYDTRGLEASYLAGAQAERAADIKDILGSYENLNIKDFGPESKIALSALIEITTPEKDMLVLLMPKGGGQLLNFKGHQIQVITPDSPLGQLMIGKEAGDIIELSSGGKLKEYEIVSIQ